MAVCGWVIMLALIAPNNASMVPLLTYDVKYKTEREAQEIGDAIIKDYTFVGAPIFGEGSSVGAFPAPIPANLCPAYESGRYDPESITPGDTYDDPFTPVVKGFFL